MTTGQPEQSQTRPSQRKRTGTRQTGAQPSGPSGENGLSDSRITGHLDEQKPRRREIGAQISQAMSKLSDIDWSRESEAITAAQAGLDEQVTLYVEGNASKAEVKSAYKAWVNAHRGGLF